MDADLAVIDPWLRGEPAKLQGGTEVSLGPRPVQVPRPPIWIGGMRPGALRRAARWDGWIAIAMSDDGSEMALSPGTFGDMVRTVQRERAASGIPGSFDVAVLGISKPSDPTTVAAFADAGATWWLESLSLMRGSPEQLLAIVEAGPPHHR